MKKVLGASIGVLAITLMSFASPQENNIKANDTQVVYDQTGNAQETTKPKPKPKPTPTPTPTPPPPKDYTDVIIIHTYHTISARNLAELNYVMDKY